MGTKTYDNLITEIGRLGRWTVSDSGSASYAVANMGAEAGLARIEREGAWVWLEHQASITLTADTYEYDFASDMWLLRRDSVRPQGGGEDSILTIFKRREELDKRLGMTWRDASTTPGSPRYGVRTGNNKIWIGPKPDATYVAAHPTLEYYYLRMDVRTAGSPLLLPDTYFWAAVHAGLAECLKQKDDNLQGYYEDLFVNRDLPDMRANGGLLSGGFQQVHGISDRSEDLYDEYGYD